MLEKVRDMYGHVEAVTTNTHITLRFAYLSDVAVFIRLHDGATKSGDFKVTMTWDVFAKLYKI